MKKKYIMLILVLLLPALLLAACCGGCRQTEPTTQGATKPTGSTASVPTTAHTDPTQTTGGQELCFTWEEQAGQITITGHTGAPVELVIPDTLDGKPVTKIAENAFHNFTSLQRVVIPGSIREMTGAFWNCTSLTEVVFADLSQPVAGVGGAFEGCIALKKLELPLDSVFSGYGCIALEELTLHTTSASFWIGDVPFGNLPSLRTVTILSEAEELEISTYTTAEISYTQFVGTEHSWYQAMCDAAQRALTNPYGYRYYEEELDDGTPLRIIKGIFDSSSWEAEPVPVEVQESTEKVGHRTVYSCYSPALIGNDLTPGVVLYQKVDSAFLECCIPEQRQDICGWETYDSCAYFAVVMINGVEYPLEIFY